MFALVAVVSFAGVPSQIATTAVRRFTVVVTPFMPFRRARPNECLKHKQVHKPKYTPTQQDLLVAVAGEGCF